VRSIVVPNGGSRPSAGDLRRCGYPLYQYTWGAAAYSVARNRAQHIDRGVLSAGHPELGTLGVELHHVWAAGAWDVPLLNEKYEAIVLSTLPPGVSRWLRMDLPSRVARGHTEISLILVISRSASGR